MKKLLLFVSSAFIIIACLTACSNPSGNTAVSAEEIITNDTLRNLGVGEIQIAFADSISEYAYQWNLATNRIKMGKIIQNRYQSIYSWIKHFQIKKGSDYSWSGLDGYKLENWIGVITSVSLDELQNATVEITLCSTTNHDAIINFRTTRINTNSNVYNQLSEINNGEWVSFSGRLLADYDDLHQAEKLVSVFDDAIAYNEDDQIANENKYMIDPTFYISINNIMKYEDFISK